MADCLKTHKNIRQKPWNKTHKVEKNRNVAYWGGPLRLNKPSFRDVNDLTKDRWLVEMYTIIINKLHFKADFSREDL